MAEQGTGNRRHQYTDTQTCTARHKQEQEGICSSGRGIGEEWMGESTESHDEIDMSLVMEVGVQSASSARFWEREKMQQRERWSHTHRAFITGVGVVREGGKGADDAEGRSNDPGGTSGLTVIRRSGSTSIIPLSRS